MEETFRVIKDFTDYQISDLGRVKTISRKIRYLHGVTKKEHFRQSEERFLKVQYNNVTGYKFYQLYKDKKMYNKTIHRLVAESFYTKGFGDSVNHIDGNKHNNTLVNLEWCSNEYNHEHATKTGLKAKGERIGSSKLNDNCVIAIKYFLAQGLSHTELSKAFNISRATISLISEGKSWRHISTGEELYEQS